MLTQREAWWRTAVLLSLGVGLALASPVFFQLIAALGWQIPQPDMVSDYLTAVGFSMLIFVGIAALPFPRGDRKPLLTVWAIKSAVCLGLMLLYEWNYPLDAYWYYELSQSKDRPPTSATATSGTETIIHGLWYLENYVFRSNSYHTQKTLISLLAFIGLYALYRGVKKCDDRVKPNFLLLLSLFPSILFWGSILGKDPINLFGICLFYYGGLSLLKRPRPYHVLPLLAGPIVVYLIRPWLVPVMILPFVVLQLIRVRHFATKVMLLGLMFAAGIYGMRYLGKSLAIESTEALTGAVNQLSRSWQRGGSATDVPELNSMGAILKFLPVGMFTALFRPLPGEVLHVFGLISGLENLFLLFLLYKGYRSFAARRISDPLVYVGISFVLMWSALYAFVSPQNLGAAVRFKLQVLPIMFVTLLYLAYPAEKKVAADDLTTPPDSPETEPEGAERLYFPPASSNKSST